VNVPEAKMQTRSGYFADSGKTEKGAAAPQ
jgi:hypothetical protein